MICVARLLDGLCTDPTMPVPQEASDQDVFEIKMAIADLEKVNQRLQERCDADGVYLALRSVMQKNVWKPRQLADQIVKGPHALKVKDGAADLITLEQLEHFLDRQQIQATKGGLSFLLQRSGSSIKSRKPLKIQRFVDSFDNLVPTPIDVQRTLED